MAEMITVPEDFVASAPHASYYDDASLASLPLVGLTVIQAFQPFIQSLEAKSDAITAGVAVRCMCCTSLVCFGVSMSSTLHITLSFTN